MPLNHGTAAGDCRPPTGSLEGERPREPQATESIRRKRLTIEWAAAKFEQQPRLQNILNGSGKQFGTAPA